MARFCFFFLLGCIFLAPSVSARSEQDSINKTDHQINFVDQVMQNIERQRSQQQAERKVEAERRLARKKKRQEARLAAQFAGLSGTLSGLPELPNFDGKFETSIPEVNDSPSENKQKSENSES